MEPTWNFLSTHGLVLMVLTRQPDLRLRDIAVTVGITERAAQNIVNDLVVTGYLERTRVGRRNHYLVRGDRPLPQGSIRSHQVADVARVLGGAVQVAPAGEDCRAVVIACSDFRIQGQLRQLLAIQGLLDQAETILWPGAPWAIDLPYGERILEAAKTLAPPDLERVLLVVHRACPAPDAPTREGVQTLREALTRLRGTVSQRVRDVFGLEPEMWFVDEEGLRGGRAPSRAAAASIEQPSA
ncbi:MAG: MarR family transcriptional regulator [Actinomycetota bacterium]|nr:MarR family transcriptional regulator [Actinomycetota bacterium]